MVRPQQKKGFGGKGPNKSFSKGKNKFSNNNTKTAGKGKAPYRKKQNINDVYEADDDDQQLQRKGHELDEVDNYEYQVGDIQGDDDEEIDSDEAFDESDDEHFDHFKFAGSTKASEKKHLKKQKKESDNEQDDDIDLNESEGGDDSEEEEEEEDMDGDDYMDIADMLDDDNSKPAAAMENESVRTLLPGSDDSDSDDSDMEEFKGFSEEEEDDDHDQEVVDFITSLDTKKRKRGVDKDGNKKRQLMERSEIYKENEFNLPVQSSTKKENKLDLKDLMGSIDGEASLGGLRETLKTMATDKKKQAALDAPLPQRVQDRLERQAAYKEASKEITRWEPTVKENREADHLSFPMQASVTQQSLTSAALASKFVPNTNMEKQIQEALEQAGMKDEELEAFEALQLNRLTVEEVEARRKELGMMRELMFRHEMKAKRMKKIKSKSYRKLKRQEKARLEEQMAKLQELDHEISQEDQLEAAVSRAEERMTLKHKNTGKWAKRALARGQLDEGTRDAIMEQLQRGQQLRRKIQGQDSDDDSNEEEEDDDDDMNSSDVNDRERVTRELDAFEKDLDQDTQPKKGLLGMKFMQDAAKREANAMKEELDEFRDEWLNENSDDDNKKIDEPTHSHVGNNPGRMAFGAKTKTNKKSTSNSSAMEESTVVSVDVKLNDAGQIDKVAFGAGHTTRTTGSVKTGSVAPTEASPLADLDSIGDNPWLQSDISRLNKKASKSNKAIKGKKIQPKQDEDQDVELDLNDVLSVKKPSTLSKKKTVNGSSDVSQTSVSASATKSSQQSHLSDNDDDSDNEEIAAPTMVSTSNKLAFNQRELVARAFANDDVLEEFEEEKEAVIAEDGDKVEDLTLPGWGAWGGKGVKNKNKSKKKFIKVTKGVDASERKDAKLSNVIINEKRHKKSEKYQAAQVPFPFKTMEQYEHSLRAPVGKEWNTRDTYQKMTKPRVMTKLGTVIDPLSAPFR